VKQSQSSPNKRPDALQHQAGVASVTPLINDLTSMDVYKCRRARKALVEIGESAVPYLVDVLNNRKGWVRWEATKALGQIPGAAATAALVAALEDNNFDVRWLAAEGLIFRGREALVPLLQALTEKSDSAGLREGAHHVLFDLHQENLGELVKPVLEALEHTDPAVEVPGKAKDLLDMIGRK